MNRSPRTLSLAALVGLASAASWNLGCAPAEKHTESAELPTIQGEAITLRAERVPLEHEATGTTRARLNAALSSKIMARVVSIGVREGDRVAAGQTLVSLDAREVAAGVEVAQANLNAATVAIGSARTAAGMENRTSQARIAQAEAAVTQAEAAVNAAQSRLDLALAGPRTQEREQATLAVQLAESNLKLAQTEFERTQKLVEVGAVASRNLDLARNALDVARAQRDSAVQAERIAQEGTRAEDVRGAREALAQARAGVRQAQANLRMARAAALQTRVREDEIRAAQAQRAQAGAALRMAQASKSYTSIQAPFEGLVTMRLADPGAMAGPGVPLIQMEGGGILLEVSVPEGLIRRVQEGDRVPLKLDALGDAWTTGTVREIVPSGDASSHTFLVKVEVPDVLPAKSGMFGRIRLKTGDAERTVVPIEAVLRREGLDYVWSVNREGIIRLRVVTLGEVQGPRVEILSGLGPGDRILRQDLPEVRDGAKLAGGQ